MVDPTDRKSIRQAQAASRRQDETDREVLVALMDHINGRDYVWRKLSDAHVFHTSFTGDPYTTAFQEGERSQGLKLLVDVTRYCPDQFILMMREADARSTAVERTSVQNGDGRDQGSTHPDPGDIYDDYDRDTYNRSQAPGGGDQSPG